MEHGQCAPMTRLILFAFILVSFITVQALAQERSGDQPQEHSEDRGAELAQAALERTTHRVTYDGSYRRIAYPMGDVPDNQGVCTDVVVRSYRAIGIDLQQLIHEDMGRSFAAYPALWGMTGPDANIDHRRVPNIRRFLERRGAELVISSEADDYLPGDVVTWNLVSRGSLPHTGIVSSMTSENGTPLIVHNIGQGPKLENILFGYEITGHYRYLPLE